MLADPLAVTYNSTAKSLPRISAGPSRAVFRTADNELEVTILKSVVQRDGSTGVSISLARSLPDPTPTDVFDPYRDIRNAFTLAYGFNTTRAGTSVDIPLLRTALLALVDSTFQGRLISGEM